MPTRTTQIKKGLTIHKWDVFVAATPRHRTFIEQVNFAGKNFTQKHLGSVCGFFAIGDMTSANTHIVHFLTAEFKKEYFASPKRSINESFIEALHHTNRALAELAKNDIISWIGQLDSALCCYNEQNIYFTTTGQGHIFLLRDGNLLHLSDGLSPSEDEINPLKTFVDTAHGEIVAGDKIIVTSRELLDLIPLDELTRNAERFKAEEFAQFLTTALVNESVLASTQLLEVIEKPGNTESKQKGDISEGQRQENTSDKIPLPKNAFSAKSYTKKECDKQEANYPTPNTSTQSDKKKLKSDYTDKRTGHIYISGTSDYENNSHPLIIRIGDFTRDATYSTKEFFTANTRRIKYEATKTRKKLQESEVTSKIKDRAVNTLTSAKQKREGVFTQLMNTQGEDTHANIAPTPSNVKDLWLKTKRKSQELKSSTTQKIKEVTQWEEQNSATTISNEPTVTGHQKPLILRRIQENKVKKNKVPEKEEATQKTTKNLTKLTELTTDDRTDLLGSLYNAKDNSDQEEMWEQEELGSSRLLRTLESTRNLWNKAQSKSDPLHSQFQYRWSEITAGTKLIGFVILLCVCTVLIMNYKAKQKEVAKEQEAQKELQQKKLEDELRETATVGETQGNNTVTTQNIVNTTQDPKILSQNISAKNILPYQGSFYLPSAKSIMQITGSASKEISLPQNIGEITHATIMPDIKLIIFITDQNLIYAFNPTDRVFTKQNIETNSSELDNTKIKSIHTYQRRLYILDTNDALTRYTRTVGGFDDAKKWITDNTDLTETEDIAIDGRIYTATNGKIFVFESGKKGDLSISGNTKITANLLYTSNNADYLWVIDKKNATLTQIEKETFSIQKTFTHRSLAQAKHFTVDESNQTAYIAGNNTLKSFILKNK